MPKTLNKNTHNHNAVNFNFDGRYFIAGCIWISCVVSCVFDCDFLAFALFIAGAIYTNELFYKDEE